MRQSNIHTRLVISTAILSAILSAALIAGCSGADQRPAPVERVAPAPPPAGPARIVLADSPIEFQDEQEPYRTEAVFDFSLPRRPRRARLKLRFSGVPGATSEDYTMGRFRHKVELNDRYLMDLNTHSPSDQQEVEYTKWISVGMFKRDNKLRFIAGDDGAREGRPNCDEFQLRSAVLELDW
ncbi:MAG: hypothetical protein JXR96_00430 [Deltaproteobacteria bacterium]|nr:hypothetical protein [Deltaproteobacteria bacterium]